MSSISRLFSFDDQDAPVLNSYKGTFITLLDAVLIDGYGEKTGLGWKKVFSGTNKAVYQNKGTEMFLQVDHNTEGMYVYFRAYESMSDIDNGLMPCPRSDIEFLVMVNIYNDRANVCPWKILGDDKGIWILTSPYKAYQGDNPTSVYSACWKLYYIGDYIPYDPANVHYNFAMFQSRYHYRKSGHIGGWISSSTSQDSYFIMRHLSGVPGSVRVGHSSGGDSYFGDHENSDITFESPYQLTTIPFINQSTCGIIGRLPGFKNSLSQEGYLGSSLNNYSDCLARKPEMVFDYGDFKEHFFRGVEQSCPWYFVLTEGKGFRNVI